MANVQLVIATEKNQAMMEVLFLPQMYAWSKVTYKEDTRRLKHIDNEKCSLNSSELIMMIHCTPWCALMVNDQSLGRSLDIHRLGATTFNDLRCSNDVVVARTLLIGEYIELQRATLKGITQDWPGGYKDPGAGRDERVAAAILAVADHLRGDIEMTATSLLRHEGRDRMPGLGWFGVQPLMTRPPGYSLPPLPSPVLIPFPNIDGLVQGNPRKQMTIECEEHTDVHWSLINYKWKSQGLDNVPDTRVDSPAVAYLLRKWTRVETMRIAFSSSEGHIPEILRDGWKSIFDYSNMHEVMCNSTLFNILTLTTINKNPNWRLKHIYIYQLPCHTKTNPDYYSRDTIPCHMGEITMPIAMQITLPNTMQLKMPITMLNTMTITVMMITRNTM